MLLRMSNSRSRSSSETPSSASPRVTAPMAKMSSISGCAACGKAQQAHAAVPAMEQPLDQARLLQPVEDARERDRLDLEELGQRALLDALVARQMRQHLALRPGQTRVRAHSARSACASGGPRRAGGSRDCGRDCPYSCSLSSPNISLLMTFTRRPAKAANPLKKTDYFELMRGSAKWRFGAVRHAKTTLPSTRTAARAAAL